VLSRIGGLLYLIVIIGGFYDEVFVRGGLIVSGDAAATAANIRSMESLWRFGIASEMVLLMCVVVLAWIFYLLLRPVSRDLALLMLLFDFVAIAVEAAIQLPLLAAMFAVGNADLVSLSVRVHAYGFGIALIFFACTFLVRGHLIVTSGYIPKAIGVLVQLAGVGYLVNSFALLLAPAFANMIFPAILLPAFIGESSICLWLLFKGVNVAKWEQQVAS